MPIASTWAIASVFGAAGSLVIVFVWVYYSAQIFLLGAEFTRVYALSFGSLRGLDTIDRRRRLGRPEPALEADLRRRTDRLRRALARAGRPEVAQVALTVDEARR